MSETFKNAWFRGWIQSSQGYEVRIVGRNDLEYRDDTCHLHLFVEPLANWKDIVLDTSTIPSTDDLPVELPRAELLDRLSRAFKSRKWNLLVDGEEPG